MLWPSQSEVARKREQGVVVFLLLTVRRRKFKQCDHMRNQWQCQNQMARFFFFPDCRKPLRSAELFVLSCRYKPTLTPAQTSCLWRAQGQIVLRSLGSTKETGQGQGSKSPQIQQCCGSAMLQMAWGCVQSDSAPSIRKMWSGIPTMAPWKAWISEQTPPMLTFRRGQVYSQWGKKTFHSQQIKLTRAYKDWRSNRSGLLHCASREQSGIYYKIPASSFLPQDRAWRPSLAQINQKQHFQGGRG